MNLSSEDRLSICCAVRRTPMGVWRGGGACPNSISGMKVGEAMQGHGSTGDCIGEATISDPFNPRHQNFRPFFQPKFWVQNHYPHADITGCRK